jgi:DNA modification methylase
MTTFNLLQGDALVKLKELEDNSIDSIVTDPPYGLSKQPDMLEVLQHWLAGDDYKHNGKGFMGKEWDSFVPGPAIWKECLRVLKPGGHMVAFFGTRTYDLGVVAIRIAGFEIRDQIAWVYGSGFPKSLNVSKAIESGGGRPEDIRRMQMGESYQPSGRGRINYDHGSGSAMDSGAVEWEPNTNSAKQWEGWGTALKPAFEPIVLARKPISTTVAENVLEYGVGGINIDGCRVEAEEGGRPYRVVSALRDDVEYNGGVLAGRLDGSLGSSKAVGSTSQGRFPANLIHDGSYEVVSLFPDSKGQLAPVKGTEKSHTGETGIYGTYGRTSFDKREEGEASSARFFYCAKASSADRDEGLDDFELRKAAGLPMRKAGVETVGEGLDGTKTFRDTKRKNIHPTVKPTDLMRYLCRLITPPGGTILDPFTGSGSTGKAAMYEGFNFVGVELMEDHMEIAEARIAYAKKDAYEISIGMKKTKAKKTELPQESDVDITKFFG